MNDGLIPQRYAKALYKHALEKGNAPQFYDVMKQVAEAFRANPDLAKVLANPYVDKADKEKLLLAAAAQEGGEDYASFVKLILQNDREPFAQQMALAFRDIYRKANKISQVTITTAAPLGADQMAQLEKLVAKAYPEATLEFNYAVNPDIIGGFVIDVDHQRLDASISNELEQLRLNLLRK